MSVKLKCIKDGGKLRVRPISGSYDREKNCKFPKNLRVEGAIFEVDGLEETRGFYQVVGEIREASSE